MKARIETERLIIRNLEPKDYKDAYKWCSDPVVNEFMLYPLYTDEEDVRQWILSINIDDPDTYDLCFELKKTGEVIGSGGLYYKKERNAWSLGYNLRKDMWGQGYIPEAMQALIAYVDKTRGIEILEGEFCIDNFKSRRVMEKLGMTYLEDCTAQKLDGSKTFKCRRYQKIMKGKQNEKQ